MPDPTQLPLFPLHTVLLPGVSLPLHIFEPRYRQLIADAMSGSIDGAEFGIVAIRNATINDVDSTSQLHHIGCSAVLREAKPTDDGRFDIVVTGGRRFRLHGFADSVAPYLVGDVGWLPDDATLTADGPTAQTLAAAARAAHTRYCTLAWSDDDWSAPQAGTPVDRLSYALAQDCLLPLADRQELLAMTDPVTRLRAVHQLLSREAGFLYTLRAVPPGHDELADLGANLN